jgi:hypothetical protein
MDCLLPHRVQHGRRFPRYLAERPTDALSVSSAVGLTDRASRLQRRFSRASGWTALITLARSGSLPAASLETSPNGSRVGIPKRPRFPSRVARSPFSRAFRPFQGVAWAIAFSLVAGSCVGPGSDEASTASTGLVSSEDLGPGGLDPCRAPETTARHDAGLPLVLARTSGFPCILVGMPPHVVIGSPDADGPSPSFRLVRLESGRFVSTSQPTSEGTILLWDSDGSFLRSYGRRGEGPGEFAGVGELLLFPGPGDSLFVVDDRSTWSVFDSDLSFARSFRGTHSGRRDRTVHVTPTRQVLTTGPVMSGGQGNAFHIMGLDGEALITTAPLSLPAGLPDRHFPRVSAYNPRSNTVWVAPPDGAPGAMILEERTLDGELLRTIRREAPWFPEGGFPPTDDPSEPPLPSYVLLHMDGDGLLWVAVTVRSDAWRPPGRSSPPLQGASRDTMRIRTQYDSRVEVIDVEAGVVLASMIIDDPLAAPFEYIFPGTRTAYRVIVDELGLNTIEVFQIELGTNRVR